MFLRIGDRIINSERIDCLEMSTVEGEFGEIDNVYCDVTMSTGYRFTLNGVEAIALESWFDDKVKVLDVVGKFANG